jgi:hypothetical protein
MTDRSPQHILQSGNPLTGKDLRDLTGMDELSLWRHCHQNPDILLKIVGKRYLRLDRQVKGFARMSPSIKREFLTYTVCGLKKDAEEVNRHVHSLAGEIQKISRDKFQFARDTITKVVGSLDFCDRVNEQVCFIIAGDIVYEMAHLEPRPEVSTGRLVKGSDLDIIIVAEEGFPDDLLTLLDKAIYQEKYMCLIKPDIREEIDYIIKDMQKTRDQLKFDRFEHMVASKILWEGQYFDGSKKVFEQIQRMLKEFHIPEKITRLTREAEKNREKAQMFLLKGTSRITEEESYRLFYTKEEAEEIY